MTVAIEHKVKGTYIYDMEINGWRLIDLIDIRAGDIFLDAESSEQFLAVSNAYEKNGNWTVEVSTDFSDLLLYYDILPKEVL